jgi:predicted alpha/beta superfamily hydrolase
VPKIYLGVGGREEAQFGDQIHMVKNVEKMASTLRAHSSETQVLSSIFEGKNHGTVIPGCMSSGLEFLLPAPPPVAH